MRPLRILYIASISPNDSSLYRAWALERLGHHVTQINTYEYEPKSSLLRKVLFRLQAGPWVAKLNRDILAAAERERPDVVWADKVLSMQPRTLKKLRAMGIPTVSYMIDNAFGPRQDPGWRLYMKSIPLYDLHATQRDKNVLDYKARGARDVLKIQTAFEPSIHFASPEPIEDAQRTRGVSFVGTPYDQRAEFLTRLWRERGFPITVSGDSTWKQKLDADALAAIYTGGELYQQGYREAMWHSKINLSFLTHSNQDEFVHKSFEIAGCGGFLLAERSPGHLARFIEDEEAVFFSDFEECAEKIARYLPDEAARNRIAAAGHARALRDGYSNDAQVAKILARIEPLLPHPTH
ncbi:glycosyltransferase [Granulicella cerasi]|uniref:Glycosyltransferase n=1 Tax=Granulicella cerasi TaxID=741063 RepID=A0ABW1Z7F8_9BACT|nr:glycosyltransferase [Granulicella cerasi]